MDARKKLEVDSKYAHLDIDGDGVVSDEEMMREERMIELADKRSDMENEDKKQDVQRNMDLVCPQWYVIVPICSSDCSVVGVGSNRQYLR